MSLIQRYSTELSTCSNSNRQHSSIEQIINDVTTLKRKDDQEKQYFNSLNNRLEELLVNLNHLEFDNKRIRDEFNVLINNWGIGEDHRREFLGELDRFTRQLSDESLRRAIVEGETKIFDELTRFTDRLASIYSDIFHLYDDKKEFLIELIKQLEYQLDKIEQRLNQSHFQLENHDEDYRKELEKYHSYLLEWSRITTDKQELVNEIQTLREYANLRSAFNQEELNEWKRLLTRTSQDSEQFYRNYLETIQEQIQRDYEQMVKEQQDEVESELKRRLEKIQMKFSMEEKGLMTIVMFRSSCFFFVRSETRQQREQTEQRFESRLNEQTEVRDRLQSDYQILTEEIQEKQRILHELETQLRTKVEQRTRLTQETDVTREEYYQLKDELDQLAYTLRFSIEEELKIYEALLNAVERKTNAQVSMNYRPLKGMITKTKYDIAQSMLGLSQSISTDERQQVNIQRCEKKTVQWEDKYMQRRIRITRRYLGRNEMYRKSIMLFS